MRVLLVNMTLDPITGGGTVPRTLQSARALVDGGMECRIATTIGAGEGAGTLLDGVEVLRLPAVGGRFRVPVAGFTLLDRAVERADIVLLVNHWTPLNVVAYRAARRTRTPYVVSPAGALPIVGRSRVAKRVYNACYGRRIVREAAGHIAITADEVEQFEGYGVPADRVTVVPNGMPSLSPGDASAFRARHGIGSAPIVLFIGRLAYIKGPDLLLRAFTRIAAARAEWHIVFAGRDDGLEASLRRAVEQDDTGRRVHFVGHLDIAARNDALAACDLVAVPSRHEAMSFVVLEAAAMARPVLVTRTCGVPDVATSGGGWTVDPNEGMLAEGLRTAMADRAALRSRGEAWQRHASAAYGWPAIAERYRELFARVVQGPVGADH
jgi:glycosyltransferase involved in cell wall biosynthesis